MADTSGRAPGSGSEGGHLRDGRREGRVKDVLEAMDRKLAGPTAPPAGLFLLRVTYPDHLEPKPDDRG